MYDYFEKTGIPSYLERIPGFELPIEPILVASETYKNLGEQLEINDRKQINKLIWGDQTPRNYKLWKVTEFENNCTPKELSELTEQSEEMMEIYDRISWYMPLTYLIIMTLFELYLLFARKRSIYILTLGLFYGYIYSMCKIFEQHIGYEIAKLHTAQWSCINLNWFVQL